MELHTPRTHDALGRRLPHTARRISPKKRNTELTDRDIFIFGLLMIHGALSSEYIRAFCRTKGFDDTRTTKRLNVLSTHTKTSHGGAYLDQPKQQCTSFYRPRNQAIIYDLNEHSIAVLKERGIWHDYKHGGWWMHQYMTACITASIHLGCIEHGLTFVPRHEVLEGRDMGVRDVPYEYDAKGKKVKDKTVLKPDALCGIRFKNGTIRYLAIEADRNTEVGNAKASEHNKRKTYQRMFSQYRHFIGGQQIYKKAYGTTGGMLVLIVTKSPQQMKNMLDIVSELTGKKGNTFLLFQSYPFFDTAFKPAPVLPIFETVCKRSCDSDFDLINS